MSTMNFTSNVYNSTDMMTSSNHALIQQLTPFKQSYQQTYPSAQIVQPELEKYSNDTGNKLLKLDLLDSIVRRLSSLRNSI